MTDEKNMSQTKVISFPFLASAQPQIGFSCLPSSSDPVEGLQKHANSFLSPMLHMHPLPKSHRSFWGILFNRLPCLLH